MQTRYATDEASLYLKNLTQLYSKELEYGDTYVCHALYRCSPYHSHFCRPVVQTIRY